MNVRSSLVQVLTHSLRIVSLDQIVRQWFAEGEGLRAGSALVRRLWREGLIEIRTEMVHPPLRLRRPLYEIRGEGDPPDFEELAYQAQLRWNQSPVRTTLVTATPWAGELTGGPLPTRRTCRDTELAHDLTLAEIFLANFYGRTDETWIPEDALLAGEWSSTPYVPDAVVRAPQGETVLELAGSSYTAVRLAAIQNACRLSGYQLW